MASFHYIARNAGGEEVTGLIQADNEASVVRALDERSLFPVEITSREEKQSLGRRRKISIRDMSIFYGQLSDLLRAGVPLLRSLDTLGNAMTNPKLKSVIRDVNQDVSSGRTLAEAFGIHPEVFSQLHIAMVMAGERAGFLEDVLANLAGFLDRQDELRSKVRGAMIYPMVLTVIGALGSLGMLMILVPRFKPFFVNISLPLPTRILFAASDILVDHKIFLLAMLVLIVLGIRYLLRSKAGHDAWERWRIRMPIFGKVTRTVSITRFCRILGTMLSNGVPILQSLSISKDATGSEILAENIQEATENVRAGERLSEPLKQSGLFPPDIVEMIAVAEESNQLDHVLVQIADTVERRINRQVDASVRLIEPLILLVIACIIGFMAVGLMYPIFNMSQTIM